jgi:hypothetical protein
MFEQAFKNIEDVRFASQTEKHELSHLYEAKIKNMGNAERNGGVAKGNLRSVESYPFNLKTVTL